MAQEVNSLIQKELISSLKTDNKGWNTALFDKVDASTVCEQCGCICCDAVELGCDHDDDDIYSYCKRCLEDLINKNHGKCPIDSHVNPYIISARSIRRQVLKSMVVCPYSSKFKKQTKAKLNDDGDVVNEEKGCGWKGTLHELVTTHINNCAKSHDPTFSQKIAIKQLQIENNKLNEIINEQTQQIKQQSLKINQLNQTVNEQRLSLNKREREMNELKKQLKDIQNKNINKENNDNDDNNTLEDYWVKCGSKMTIYNKAKVTFYGKGYVYNTVYGQAISQGIHQWKIKILKSLHLYIGIASTMNHCEKSYAREKDPHNAVYRSDGQKVSNHTIWTNYGEAYGEGDIITINLDLSKYKKQISFRKNGKSMGVAFTKIDSTEYRLAVCMYLTIGSVEMISYRSKKLIK